MARLRHARRVFPSAAGAYNGRGFARCRDRQCESTGGSRMGRQIGRREFLKRGTLAGVVTATGLPAATLLSGATRTAVPAAPAASSIAGGELADLAERQLDSLA